MSDGIAEFPRDHNQPPLELRLNEELASFNERAAALVEVAATAIIVDDVSASKVVDLAGLMRELESALTDRRAELKRPYQEAQRLIDQAFVAAISPLARARVGEDGRGGLRGMLSQYQARREAEAAAERGRLAEEQRKREEDAAAARRAAEAKREAGKGTVGDELAALKAEDEAADLGRRAAAVRPEPIRAQLGQVSQVRSIAFKITDLRKALSWAVRSGLEDKVAQALRTIVGAWLRQLGVDAIERGAVDIPGVEVSIERQASIRR